MVLGNFPRWGVPLVWFIVGLGPALLTVSAGGVVLMCFFSIIYPFSSSFFLAGRRLGIEILKGPLNISKPTKDSNP